MFFLCFRDAMIAMLGLLLVIGRFDGTRSVLETFAANWTLVYIGNFPGSIFLAFFLTYKCGLLNL
jgi:glycogen debranching enzyme